MQVSTGLPPPLMSWAGTAVAGSPRQHEQERLQRSSHRCLSQLDASHPVASLPALNSSTPLSKQKSRILPMLILQRYNLPHAKRPSGAIFNCRVWILTTLWRSGVCTEAAVGSVLSGCTDKGSSQQQRRRGQKNVTTQLIPLARNGHRAQILFITRPPGTERQAGPGEPDGC